MDKLFIYIDDNSSIDEIEKVIRYNIGRANIIRNSIKELDKAIHSSDVASKSNDSTSTIVDSDTIEKTSQEEYLYYYNNMQSEIKKTLSYEDVINAVLNSLPSRENKKYIDIVNRIKLELFKEIHELDVMLLDNDIINDQGLVDEIGKEKQKIHEIIEAINFVQVEKKETQIEKSLATNNKLIFLETPSGSIYAESDLYSIPDEYYETFRNLLMSIKNGTFKNVKMLNDRNGISEVKDFKTRVVFDRIGTDCYVIISIFTKKCDTDSMYRESLTNRIDCYKRNKPCLLEMIKSSDFLDRNYKIETRLLDGLSTKNLVKTTKGGGFSGI